MKLHRIPLSLAACGALALASGCAAPAKGMKSTTDVTEGNPAGALPSRDTSGDLAASREPAAPQGCSLERVHFSFDSAVLDGAARNELKGAAACLAEKHPADLLIEGHCDERGTAAYNLALGNKRAAAVRGYLGDLGVSLPMKTLSFGKELPIAPGHDEAAWRENRRAELKLPGEKRSDGGQVATR